ncbi:sugar kinase, partial [Escherichia coli]|uniref:PfkB family carbohydrate kinase n=1 Tax=Escherichia coli TaxID=562 RepID=UPI0011D4F3D7
DFTAMLDVAPDRPVIDCTDDELGAMAEGLLARYPHLQVVASTVRRVHSASRNDFGGLAWSRGEGLCRPDAREGLEILDRVGGGDGFAAGLVHALLTGGSVADGVANGTALGALAMTTPGDAVSASEAEVLALARGGSAHAIR